MNQLFLAVLKARWEGLKGRSFSRYGPARTEKAGYGIIPDRQPIESSEVPAPLSATSRAVTAKPTISYPSSCPYHVIDRAVLSVSVRIGRMNMQHIAAGLRTLELNDLAAPLLPEGAS